MRFFITIIFSFIYISSPQALVLEDLITAGTLQTTIENKKIGFYVGSFDPLHKGHEHAAELTTQHELCDFVLIYPAWGGDNYKSRAPISVRLDMLFSVFKDHPRVIVTRLNPQELQTALTLPDPSRRITNKPAVKPAFKGLEFIGLIGSDTALSLDPNKEALAAFMTGIVVPDKYKAHTLGGIMALPVETFIVALREGDDLKELHEKVGDRSILTTIESQKDYGLSSTLVKKILRGEVHEGPSIETLVSPSVLELIEKNGLYTQS